MVVDLLQTKKVENVFVAGEYFILHKYTEVLISNQMINRGIEIMLDVKFKKKINIPLIAVCHSLFFF